MEKSQFLKFARPFTVGAASIAVSGCTSVFSALYPGPVPIAAPPEQEVVLLVRQLQCITEGKINADGSCADTATLSAVSPATFTAAGYAKVERACDAYFDQIHRATTTARFAEAELALIGAAAAGIMAIASASAKAIGVTAAGFGVASQTSANYRNYVLVASFPAESRRITRRALEAFKEKGTRPEDVKTMEGAVSAIGAYAMVCTPDTTLTLVREAIDAARLEPDTDENRILDSLGRSQAADAARGLNVGPFDDEGYVMLYLLLSRGGDDTVKKALEQPTALGSVVVGKVTGASFTERTSAQGKLQAIHDRLRTFRTAVETLRNAIAKQAEDSARTARGEPQPSFIPPRLTTSSGSTTIRVAR